MGDLRYFSDRFGRARGSIEGTQLPYELLWEHAEGGEDEVVYDPGHRRAPLRARRVRSYQGFELDSEEAPVTAFTGEMAGPAREALAAALSAGAAYHRDTRENRARVRELREVHRRSRGTTADPSERALREHFLERLADVDSYPEFLETDLALDLDAWVSEAERRRWLALPGEIELAGTSCPLDYALEGEEAVVRVRVPEKLLPRIEEQELPELDRPLRWTVLRGKREALRASTLEEARELAARPRVQLRREGLLESTGGESGRRGSAKGRNRQEDGRRRGGGRGGRKGEGGRDGGGERGGGRRKGRGRGPRGHRGR